MVIAVIADMVGSRRLEDRAAAQRTLDESIERVQRDRPTATVSLTPTVGDEQQGIYPDLVSAMEATALLQLALPDAVGCRFGLGVGEVGSVASSAGEVPEGPGWWAAREAIEIVHAKQLRAVPTTRSWIVAAPEEDDGMRELVAFANAYLLGRDRIIRSMTERERRLSYGRCLRRTQRELAEDEGISQSAVSQALASAGTAALVEGLAVLRERRAG